jgi:alpha-N-arabinofuranosidase
MKLVKQVVLLVGVSFFTLNPISGYAQRRERTVVTIKIPECKVYIDSMIYGQMLEDCNDKIIYGGILNMDGSERHHVAEMLKPLHIPVMRWLAGTYIHEYKVYISSNWNQNEKYM